MFKWKKLKLFFEDALLFSNYLILNYSVIFLISDLFNPVRLDATFKFICKHFLEAPDGLKWVKENTLTDVISVFLRERCLQN